MKKCLLRLWRDEAGYVVSTEAVLVSAIVLMGLITGLTTFRNAIVEELADAAAALGTVNQTYSYGAITSHNSSVAGSSFTDALDYCEDGSGGQGFPGGVGTCLDLSTGGVTAGG